MAPLDADRRPERHDRTLIAARFADAACARCAIEALQSTGVDGEDIKWLSPFPEELHRPARAADRRITRYLLRRVLVGALTGALAGGLVGLIVGGILVAATNPAAVVGEIVALAAVGIVFGAQLGAYVGFEGAGTLSDAWSTSFDELEAGATWIGVRTTDAADRERALHALGRQQPIEVREL